MATAIYDNSLLPCMTFPFNNTHTKSKRYLGGQALTGKIYADIKITCKNDDEMIALHDFYSVDCKYGLDPFIFTAPLFGFDTDIVDFVGEFEGDFSPVKDETLLWTVTMKVKILAPILLIRDDAGEIVTDDAGEYIYTDTSLHSSSDNIISYVPTDNITL